MMDRFVKDKVVLREVTQFSSLLETYSIYWTWLLEDDYVL